MSCRLSPYKISDPSIELEILKLHLYPILLHWSCGGFCKVDFANFESLLVPPLETPVLLLLLPSSAVHLIIHKNVLSPDLLTTDSKLPLFSQQLHSCQFLCCPYALPSHNPFKMFSSTLRLFRPSNLVMCRKCHATRKDDSRTSRAARENSLSGQQLEWISHLLAP
jgi:hypothetical protein